MNENEFLEHAKKQKLYYKKVDEGRWGSTGTFLEHLKLKTGESKAKKVPFSLENDYFYVSWTSGGVSGGSCYNDDYDSHYAIAGDPEPEFSSLDGLLVDICPNISFLQYKKLLSLTKHDTYTSNEYYGNSRVTSFKHIRLKELYEELVKLKVI